MHDSKARRFISSLCPEKLARQTELMFHLLYSDRSLRHFISVYKHSPKSGIKFSTTKLKKKKLNYLKFSFGCLFVFSAVC